MACIPTVQLYHEAAYAVTDLLDTITPATWTGPGLGEWDVRSLVGHTSRSLTTVLTYLDQPAERADIATPERYFALVAGRAAGAAVAERGRQAGQALGPDPAAAFRELHDQITERLDSADPDAVITTVAGGMRLAVYLPTRTFELVVHGLDIAAATASTLTFSPAVLKQATDLAGRIAVELGRGPTVLQALTGRTTLPAAFSIVG